MTCCPKQWTAVWVLLHLYSFFTSVFIFSSKDCIWTSYAQASKPELAGTQHWCVSPHRSAAVTWALDFWTFLSFPEVPVPFICSAHGFWEDPNVSLECFLFTVPTENSTVRKFPYILRGKLPGHKRPAISNKRSHQSLGCGKTNKQSTQYSSLPGAGKGWQWN